MAVFVWATAVIPTAAAAAVTATFSVNNRTLDNQTFRAILWDHNGSVTTKTPEAETGYLTIPPNQSRVITLTGTVDDYEVEVRLPSEHMDLFGSFISGSPAYLPGNWFRDFSSTENP